MKNLIIFILTIILINGVTGQSYTWERHNTSYTGGHQSTGTYTSFLSPNWFQSGIITNPELVGFSGFLTPKLDTRPPSIDTIIDVPFDQGRWVQVIWDKCGYDEFYNQANFYSIWREDDDPEGKDLGKSGSTDIYEILDNASKFPKDEWYWLQDGMVWTYIDQIPALIHDTYSYNAPTLIDSISLDDLNLTTFQIVFHELYVFYESLPDSGYSVDNLAPFAPVLEGDFMINHIVLEWDKSLAEDFQHFTIYKSNDDLIFPEQPFATTSDTNYFDYDLNESQLFYKVTATDFNGNESAASNVISIETTFRFDLTVFLEGPFSGSSMSTELNNQNLIPFAQPYNVLPWNYSGTESVVSIPGVDIVDWVLIELRDASDAASATPSTLLSKQAAFLKNDGSVVNTDGSGMLECSEEVDQNLFIIVWHRNHLGIMSSANPIITDGALSYNFSISETNVYGGIDGYKELSPGIWGMVTGDGNKDGYINSGDKISSWNLETGAYGYLQSDFNLDSQVNNMDKNDTWLINFGKTSQVPE